MTAMSGWTIDEVPLDWFVGDGVVMDFHDKPMDTRSPPRMWRSTSRRSTTPSKPGDIVFLRTDAG